MQEFQGARAPCTSGSATGDATRITDGAAPPLCARHCLGAGDVAVNHKEKKPLAL